MFKLHAKGSEATEAIEYRVAGSAIGRGVLVKYYSGKLAVASGTDVPEYVTLGASTASGDEIPVKRIYEDEIYETVLQAAGTSLNLGDKVTVYTDGAQVTATTTNGIFEIIEMDGTAVGSKVRGLFRR